MSESVLIPHFDYPFRISGGKVVTVEQDSIIEVANCVEVILTYPKEWRIEDLNFGLRDQLFLDGGVNLEDFVEAVEQYEPRADAIFEMYTDDFDQFLYTVRAIVQGRLEGRIA